VLVGVDDEGKLSGDLTFEDLKTDNYQAYARNKQLAEAFYLTHDIEKYGSGFVRIRKAIEDYPTMKFDFREFGNGFVTEFSYTEQKTSTKKEGKKETDLKTDLKTDDIDKLILSVVADNKDIIIPEIAKVIKLSVSGTKLRLNKLKTAGLLSRIDGKKGGYWKIIK